MDRIRQLEVFRAAVQHGSIAAAGRELGLSPAMAGKYLSTLESTLGARLLQRTTRALSLTDAGQRYLSASQAVLDTLAEADAEARGGKKQLSGPIRLGVPRAYGELKLAPILTDFCQRYPDISLDLRVGEHYADLVDARLDLAIRIGQLADSALRARRIGQIAMGVFGAPALASAGERQQVEHVRTLPRLAFSGAQTPGDWTVFDARERACVLDGTVAMRADDIMMLVRAATAGLGILYAPVFAVESALASGDLVPLLSNYHAGSLDLHIVYNARSHQPARIRALINHLARDVV